MAVDFWGAKVHSTKHFSTVQAGRLNSSDAHLIMDDTEGDDDVRAWFPCPFCYVEVEIPVFCSHLQEEHCYNLKNAVCPMCAANLGKDAIGHFLLQHAPSVKRRRKCQKSGYWNSSVAMIGKDLSAFLGSNSVSGRSNVHEPSPDPLLSPFLCNVSLSDPKDNQQDEAFCSVASTTSDVTSSKSSMSDEVQEEDYEERRQRAAFVQELMISTIF
ncbi:unnamed protein product [Ilex paraguariensis]|uniref:Protein DEHYDRATION-INDUCED 19 homolog 5-like n=1 Tax=Ilex paraguariensis TaxID=185542 RepID=A0ABC8QXR3_9AQUA